MAKADNFQSEQITFDIVEFDTAYNSILGRTTLAKFMAASHYAYQLINIPEPKGTIIISRTPRWSCSATRGVSTWSSKLSPHPPQLNLLEK